MKAPIGIFALSVFIGSFIGAMANITPFQVVLLSAAMLIITTWVEEDDSLVSFMLSGGALIGGVFGAMVSQVPWGFALLMGITLFIKVWRRPQLGTRVGGVSTMIVLPLLTILGVGLFYNFSYTDFCISATTALDVCADPNNWVNGYPTIWTQCISTCGITPFSLLGSSIFSTFILQGANGDYIGLLFNLLNPASQTGIGFILSIVTLALGAFLVLLSLGIGFTAGATALTVGTSGGITVNEAGTRLAQSYGIGLIMWSVVFLGFGYWILNSFAGLFGFALGTSMIILLASTYFYGLYIQGKSVAT